MEGLTTMLVDTIAPQHLPGATRLRRLQEATSLLTDISGTIYTPTRHTWQHELNEAGEELKISANRV
ncbi:hypothetical protein MY11210_003469 [Beauveria gryllotalpidicola]